MGGMAWPFNSSNTALESATLTWKAVSAEKWRFSPAGISASKTTLLSARMRTRVSEDVDTERSSGAEFAAAEGRSAEEAEAGCVAVTDCVEIPEEGLARRCAE